MTGSIERLWQLIPRHQVVPVVLLAVGIHTTPDPTRRPTGYGGVLPVPAGSRTASSGKLDPLLEQQRRDMRAARGRVLYAPGRAPLTAPAKTAHKTPCPAQRVSERPSTPALPAS